MSLGIRLEPDPRTTDPREGAAVPLADPAWMLGRQWWVGELRGTDGGAPVAINFRTRTERLIAPDNDPESLAPSTILAAPLAQDENRPGDWRQALRLGRRIATRIDRELDRMGQRGGGDNDAAALINRWKEARKELSRRFPIEEEHPALVRLSPVDRINGLAMLHALDTARDDLEPFAQLVDEIRDNLPGQAEFDLALGGSTADLQSSSWGTIPVPGAPGPRLHLSDVDLKQAYLSGLEPVAHRALPSRLSFAGSPPQRWWSIEEGALHWGAAPAGPSDLGQLVVAAGMAVQHRPLWFVGFEVPCNSIFAVEQVSVQDGFGTVTEAEAMQEAISGAWRSGGPHAPMLILTEGPHLSGDPVDEVLIAADEGDNVMWMVELRAQGDDGWPRVVNGKRETREVDAPAYALRLSPPENWLAYLASQEGTLVRRPLSTRTGRRGFFSRFAVEEIEASPEMIGGAGRGFAAAWRLTRSASGARHLWLALHESGPNRIGGSGLAHDRILYPEA